MRRSILFLTMFWSWVGFASWMPMGESYVLVLGSKATLEYGGVNLELSLSDSIEEIFIGTEDVSASKEIIGFIQTLGMVYHVNLKALQEAFPKPFPYRLQYIYQSLNRYVCHPRIHMKLQQENDNLHYQLARQPSQPSGMSRSSRWTGSPSSIDPSLIYSPVAPESPSGSPYVSKSPFRSPLPSARKSPSSAKKG